MLAGDLEAAEHELRKDYRALEEMGDRNYLSTAAGLLAEVLYGQDRHQESAEFAGVCRDLGSPDDVASQFLWRSVQAKLLAQGGQHERAEAILAEALELINSSDWVDWQGIGFRNLAEIRQLRGRTSDAIEALTQAAVRFAAKGNVVSLRRTNELADALRETQQNAPHSAQPAARVVPGPEGLVAET
jgi:tetratricopeptide (TPR) repeat protein